MKKKYSNPEFDVIELRFPPVLSISDDDQFVDDVDPGEE